MSVGVEIMGDITDFFIYVCIILSCAFVTKLLLQGKMHYKIVEKVPVFCPSFGLWSLSPNLEFDWTGG